MKDMPKSTLTNEDLVMQEYIILLKYDLELWQKGFSGQSLSQKDRELFHELGSLVFGSEGFNDLY